MVVQYLVVNNLNQLMWNFCGSHLYMEFWTAPKLDEIFTHFAAAAEVQAFAGNATTDEEDNLEKQQAAVGWCFCTVFFFFFFFFFFDSMEKHDQN